MRGVGGGGGRETWERAVVGARGREVVRVREMADRLGAPPFFWSALNSLSLSLSLLPFHTHLVHPCVPRADEVVDLHLLEDCVHEGEGEGEGG